MVVRFKKLVPEAKIPSRAHVTDVGFDVSSVSCEYDEVNDVYIYHTGLAVATKKSQDRWTHAVYAYPRSSNRKTDAYLANHVGLIDADGYRGEIQVSFKNRTSLNTMIEHETLKRMVSDLWMGYAGSGLTSFDFSYDATYKKVKEEFVQRAKNLEFAPYGIGDRLVQLVFACEEVAAVVEVDEIDMDTDRGTTGHGDSGK